MCSLESSSGAGDRTPRPGDRTPRSKSYLLDMQELRNAIEKLKVPVDQLSSPLSSLSNADTSTVHTEAEKITEYAINNMIDKLQQENRSTKNIENLLNPTSTSSYKKIEPQEMNNNTVKQLVNIEKDAIYKIDKQQAEGPLSSEGKEKFDTSRKIAKPSSKIANKYEVYYKKALDLNLAQRRGRREESRMVQRQS